MEKNENLKQDDQLNLNDLKNVVAVFDFAASQGIFRSWETMETVKKLRDKIDNFVKKAEPKVENKKDEEKNTQSVSKKSRKK